MGPKRITLADVAIEAGVSVQTASHVLSENLSVRLPESTRQRVKDAAERVGYRPNRLAQAMKRGKSHVIGVWLPVDRPILAYLRFLQAVSSTAREQNYELMITGLQGSDAYGATGKVPPLWPVDGIMGFDAGKAITALRENPAFDSTPVLIFGFETCSNGDSVAWDVAEASKEVTRRLIQRGCRRIVHVTMDWVLSDFPREQRRRGYSEAMLEAGLSPEFATSEKETSSAAETATLGFISERGIPDAFTGFTDTLAIGAARAVLSLGKAIPQDCKVWGFSDFPEAEDFRVPISSIRLPMEDVVDLGWKWLNERIANPDIESRMAVLPMQIIERESTRPAS